MKSKAVKIIIGIVISLLTILWLIYNINWNEVFEQLKTVNYSWLIAAFAVIFLQFILRAVRWRYLVPDSSSMPFALSYDGIMLANFANYILPLRAGEFVRPYFLSRNSNNSFSNCFAGVVIERFFDLTMVLIMFKLSLSAGQQLDSWIEQGANALFILAACILVFIVLAVLAPNTAQRVSNFLLSFLPQRIRSFFSELVSGLLEGAQVVKSGKNLFLIIFLSALVWLDTALGYYVLLCMFDFKASFYQAIIVTVVVALAVAAPSAPGFIGVFQVACIAAFALLGLSKETATTYALLSHLQMYLIVIVWGTLIMLKYGLALKDFQKEPRKLNEM